MSTTDEPQARGGLPHLLERIASAHASGEPCVLGIVIATTGSTYQKPGAVVLLDRTGMRHGAISGGCLEPELEDRARKVLRDNHAELIEFDTRSDEDLIFGSGTGCRGRIGLMLLPQAHSAPLSLALAGLADATGTLDVTIVIAGDDTGCGCARLGDETWYWRRDGRSLARTEFERAASSAATTRVSINPPPTVVLLGTGPETAPLHLFMQRLGWRALAVEHRGRWLKFAHAAGIEHIVEQRPDEAAAAWRREHPDAAIAMTHNFALDLEHLRICAGSDVPYVGLLGPAARRDALLADLGESDAGRLRARLHGPVGLGLGGSGPEAVALAIVAELQQHFVKRQRIR